MNQAHEVLISQAVFDGKVLLCAELLLKLTTIWPLPGLKLGVEFSPVPALLPSQLCSDTCHRAFLGAIAFSPTLELHLVLMFPFLGILGASWPSERNWPKQNQTSWLRPQVWRMRQTEGTTGANLPLIAMTLCSLSASCGVGTI